MAQVNYSPTAESQLQELILTLYEQEYFGFLESAEDYVNAIYDFIDRLPQYRFRAAKDKRYGDWFCRYTHNKKLRGLSFSVLTTKDISFDISPTITAWNIRSW